MQTFLHAFRATLWLLPALAYPSLAASSSTVAVMLDDSVAGGKEMRLSLDRQAVPPGPVTFTAVNRSKSLVHEVIVVKVKSADAPLPYNAKRSRIIESRIRHLGEISDLEPGKSGTLTLNLKPGAYLLVCNQPGHYKAGMSAALAVRADTAPQAGN